MLDGCGVALAALALPQGPLLRVDPQPTQTVEERRLRLAGGPLPVGILDAQHQRPPVAPGERPVEERRTRRAYVQESRGARGKAGAYRRHEGGA